MHFGFFGPLFDRGHIFVCIDDVAMWVFLAFQKMCTAPQLAKFRCNLSLDFLPIEW